MSPPLFEKKIYTLEEVNKIRLMAQCEEINIFFDHQKIIANLCNTILDMQEKIISDRADGDDHGEEKQKK